MVINTSFDVRTDAGGKDPDTYSPTLCRYHRLLWSKPLPGGIRFELGVPATPPYYLNHRSDVGEFWLSSDSVIATFTGYNTPKPIVGLLSDAENEAFIAIAYTIGGFLLWPANRVDGKQTINGARGFRRNIADRLDITLECILRHYRGQESPLGDVLARYSDFFALFEDFRGYVDFWLLQDLVDDNYSAVRYFMPFDEFKPPAKPQDIDAYREYRRLNIEFVQARNRRIDDLELEIWNRPRAHDLEDPENLVPILNVPRKSGWYRGWETEFEFAVFGGEIWEVRNLKTLYNRVFKRLWETNRTDVLAYSDSHRGRIFVTAEPHRQFDALPGSHYLFMGFFPQYMLCEIQGVLHELNMGDDLFVKYSTDEE